MSLEKPEYYTSQEVCAVLRRSAKTLGRLRKKRAITFIRTGGKFLYPISAVNKFLNDRTIGAAA